MMKEKSTTYLRRRRKALMQKMHSIGFNIIRGSLLERYKPCGKPNCRCADGPGHGPKYYLSVSHSGRRPELEYVPGRACPTSETVCFKLQKGKTTHGRNKRHQPGNSPAQRTIVEQGHGYYSESLYRYRGNWLLGSQYAFGFPKGQSIRGGGI